MYDKLVYKFVYSVRQRLLYSCLHSPPRERFAGVRAALAGVVAFLSTHVYTQLNEIGQRSENQCRSGRNNRYSCTQGLRNGYLQRRKIRACPGGISLTRSLEDQSRDEFSISFLKATRRDVFWEGEKVKFLFIRKCTRIDHHPDQNIKVFIYGEGGGGTRTDIRGRSFRKRVYI